MATGRNRLFEGEVHVSARTRLQHARRPCRRQARSGDRRARDADLPDHVLRVRRCRPCRLAVRAEGVRQHLHPHHEPDPGGAGRAARRARRRHGGACRRHPATARSCWCSTPSCAPATISSRRAGSMAARSTSSATPSRISTGRCAGPTRTIPRASRSQIDEQTRGIFIESLANPGGEFVDIEKIGDIARKHGLPLIVDNTLATPVSGAADRARRRHRRAFADQIHRRPRQFDGRRHRRRRHLQLVEVRQLSDAVGAAAGIWRRRAARDLRQFRLRHRLPGARPARSRPGDLAVQCVPDPDRAGDAAAPDAAPLRQRARRRRMAVQASEGRLGVLSRPAHRQEPCA